MHAMEASLHVCTFTGEMSIKQKPCMPEAKVAEEPMGLSSHMKVAQRLLFWPSCYAVSFWHSFLSLVLYGLKSVGQNAIDTSLSPDEDCSH